MTQRELRKNFICGGMKRGYLGDWAIIQNNFRSKVSPLYATRMDVSDVSTFPIDELEKLLPHGAYVIELKNIIAVTILPMIVFGVGVPQRCL